MNEVFFGDRTTCWNWPFDSRNHKGYAALLNNSCGEYDAYKWAITLDGRPNPNPISDPPLHIRHTCHNKSCCNPNHLIWGTTYENRQDTVEIGNHARGETNGHAKLTEENVRYIRSVGELGRSRWPRRLEPNSQAQLAEEFNVSPETINNILAGRVWKHLL